MSGVNVCGLVVHVAPTAAERVRRLLAGLDGVDVHAADGDRLVVTAVDTEGVQALQQMTAINRLPGVVSTSLAYHQVEDAPPPCGCGQALSHPASDCPARP